MKKEAMFMRRKVRERPKQTVAIIRLKTQLRILRLSPYLSRIQPQRGSLMVRPTKKKQAMIPKRRGISVIVFWVMIPASLRMEGNIAFGRQKAMDWTPNRHEWERILFHFEKPWKTGMDLLASLTGLGCGSCCCPCWDWSWASRSLLLGKSLDSSLVSSFELD